MKKGGGEADGIWKFANNSGGYTNTYYVNGIDTQAGFGYVEFYPNANGSYFVMDYKRVGHYYLSDEEQEYLERRGIISSGTNRINVGCRVKHSCRDFKHSNYWGANSMSVSKNFYNGLWYSHFTIDTEYEFFITSTYNDNKHTFTSISLNNTCLTTNSLNSQEAVAYLSDKTAPGICLDAQINKFFQKIQEGNVTYFRGSFGKNALKIPGTNVLYSNGVLRQWGYEWWHQYSFNDWRGSSNLSRSGISFKLKSGITKHIFSYKTYDESDASISWICPSAASLGLKTINPVKEFKKTGENDSKYRKNVKNKVTSNFYVNNGEEITFRITQKIHSTGESIVDDYRYNILNLTDTLSDQLKYKSSVLKMDGEVIPRDKYELKKEDQTLTVIFKKNFLDNLALHGQTITWEIGAKVVAKNSNIIKNKSTTRFNNKTANSNEITLNILPAMDPKITKTGPEKITDVEEIVNYTINYTDEIKYYKGGATVTIVDTLPYKVNENVAHNYDGGTYNDSNKTITWTFDINNINSFEGKNNKINITKKISVVFKGFSNEDKAGNNKSMTNIVQGYTTTKNPSVRSEIVKDTCKTSFDFVIDITAKKTWNDDGRDKSKRPDPLYFVLYSNGSPTNQRYKLSPSSKNTESYTFSRLPKYGSDGKKIKYEVREISKESGNDKYRLQDLTSNVVKSKDDLRYYLDTTSVEESPPAEGGKTKTYDIVNTFTAINIKGNVWKDLNINGIRDSSEGKPCNFQGVSVEILIKYADRDNFEPFDLKVRTNADGKYEFLDLPWNGTYKVRIHYNGQIYEQTYYMSDLTLDGINSNFKENDSERMALNERFSTISAYPNNYEENRRAFGLEQKIKDRDGNYILKNDGTAYTFNDMLVLFDNVDLSIKEYNNSFWTRFQNNIQQSGVDNNTAVKIKEYIQDSIMYSDTPSSYSENNFKERGKKLEPGIYTVESVSSGLARRKNTDLEIVNDVYKVTQIINGKNRGDLYNNKEVSDTVSDRSTKGLYNGNEILERPVFKSDYLYDAKNLGLNDYQDRNLQVYVTYRVRIINKGDLSAKVNSIAFYYDSNYYEEINDKQDSIINKKISKDNTFIGDEGYNKIGDLGLIIDDNDIEHGYNKLILSGKESGNAVPIKVKNGENIDDILHPNRETSVYITLKVKQDKITNRVFIDKEINSIAEINSYSTLYTPEDKTVIPYEFNNKGERVNKEIKANQNAGVVDIDSDPGSLVSQEIDTNGKLIYKRDKCEIMEDDTDQIGIKITVSQDEKDIRSIGGITFEDERNYQNNDLLTSIGNGYLENSENGKRIKGVTLQLVELIPEIDAETKQAKIEKKDGRDVIKYIEEKVIGTYQYTTGVDGEITTNSTSEDDENDDTYYSGIGTSKVIITGGPENEKLEVKAKNISDNGEYRFDSIYPGDFYVRFIYGDTVRTTLTNTANEVNELLKDTQYKGLNEKSYNGQDYKSTIYQSAFDNKGIRTEIDQSGSYYGIDGFGYNNGTKDEGKYNTQNFTLKTDIENQNSMYYYDLQKSNNINVDGNRVRVSDAKDIYQDRLQSMKYSLDLVNRNAEVLNSYNKVKSELVDKKDNDKDKIEQQYNAIKELMENTKIRANTGIIDIEFNHNNSSTNEVDLGLVERARAQLSLVKEVSNIKIVLSNDEVLFDTNKSVNNLFFSKHTEHGIDYKNYKINAAPTINELKGEKTAEVIQAYMDQELINGANLQLDYMMRVKNVGEVDYLDSKYYYTGLEDDPVANISKTTINKVIDYNSNTTLFKSNINENDKWRLVDANYLLTNGLVSKRYEDELKTYKTILVNENMAGATVPEMFKKAYNIDVPSEYSADLTMQSDMGYKSILGSFMYNNISEIVESKNMYGRKNEYSVPGNQELTDQRKLLNAIRGKSSEDRMTPAEIDADSAQKVGILPPTGEREYMFFIFVFTIGLGVALVGIFIIRGLVFSKKYIKDKK